MTYGTELEFIALPGYFASFEKDDSKAVDSTKVDQNTLINHNDWKELYDAIPEDTEDTHYKLLLLARHGQGYHNYSMQKYGLKLWDDYWSLLEGDEGGSWLDSRLTEVGRNQVSNTGEEILVPLVDQIGFLPHIFFTSPMRRCLETFVYSWNHVFTKYPEMIDGPIVYNNVIENLRENLGSHTCDKRVDHSEAVEEYQDFKTKSGHTVRWIYEEKYPEKDNLWEVDHRETPDELDVRTRKGLQSLFSLASSKHKFLSLTCHEGVINSVLRNLQHPGVQKLQTSETVAVVVKVSNVKN